jgi:hypothetical protein
MKAAADKVAACTQVVGVSRIKVSENGRKATFMNDKRERYKKIKIDGCVMSNTLAADWMVCHSKYGQIIVELKGSDVEHAAKQVFATASFLQERGLREGHLAALIVANQFPRFNTIIQRRQSDFASKYDAPMHVVTKNHTL